MSPIKALIIDDSDSDRALVKRALGRAGEYEVVEVTSRPQLEAKLGAEDFDVIISDFNILGLNGLEVLEVVHTLCPETPVILLTGTGSEEIAVTALRQGAADYVIKSVSHIKKLPATIAAALDRTSCARERESLQEALRRSEERYRTLVETAEEAVVSVDDDVITFFNRGAERMFGYAGEEVVGRPIATLVPAGGRDAFDGWVANHLARHEAANGAMLAMPLSRQGGEEFSAEISVVPVNGGAGAGFTAVIRDVTEKKRLEEEVARLDRLASIGEMTSGIAHEVRNPLAAIATSATVARQELAAAGLDTENADWILESARKIEGLLKRFFDFARPLTLERQPCDVGALIREVVREERPNLEASGVEVEFEGEDDLPTLSLDPGLIRSVFSNVIVNARHVMPEGGDLKIRARLAKGGAAVVITFADTGPGISEEEARRVLEPFVTTQAGGVGLGLPLCLKIAKAHGGDFTIRGGGRGAEVTVTLPVAA